ncbi:methyl-accepting chemotaxis protein [Tepidicella baoligensis]|uniref:methyl-accepting chemotaxis protein n=1 Tax=Tepidicella baoligensis TaxID=2707016 RepID=UPI001C5C9CA8|nr:methyl-accepting chemotaxis protein [Tepidicella baoligensis]
MRLGNLRIGWRLGLGFGSVLILMGLLVAFALYEFRVLAQDVTDVRQQEQRAAVAREWADSTRLNIARVMAIATSGNAPAVDRFFSPQITQTTERINVLQKTLEEQAQSEEERALLARIAQLRTDYINTRREFFALLSSQPQRPVAAAEAEDAEAAQAAAAAAASAIAAAAAEAERFLQGRLLPSAEAYMAAQRQFVELQGRLSDVVAQHAATEADTATRYVLALAAIGLLVGVIVAVSMSRTITAPLKEAVGVANRVAEGDLTRQIHVDRRDEVGELLQALNAMQASLLRVIDQIRESSDSIGQAASEIAMGNQDLSSRTEQSASSLEETASSMEELTATVRQSADAARQANQLATSAAEVASRGGAVVGQVVQTMNDINQSSQRISDIISVIDGIAFQTNILALNAAVEAARAGEQGRGFAVVAGEVRTLAQRSAQAAKEIKDLINDSVQRVQDGSRLVQDAGATMSEIVTSVQRVTDIVGEISAAAAEQSDGIAQVNVAVAQLDQMTQQNAALVEQSAAAAQSLRDQAERLAQVIAAFRTGAAARAVVDASHRSPPAKPAAQSAAGKPITKTSEALPPPKPHPAAKVAAISSGSSRSPSAPTAAPAAAPKALPKSPPATAPKPATNADGDWESF